MGCLSTLLTAGEIIGRVLLILFIPIFVCGGLMMFTGGTVFDPVPANPTYTVTSASGGDASCMLMMLAFWGCVILLALKRLFFR